MNSTEHAVHTTPSLGWVLEKMADKTAKPVTPYGAWLVLRRPLLDAIAEAEASPALDWQPGQTAAYEAASAAVTAAKVALRDFDRKSQKPHTAKVWKDVGANDPLLQAIFGDTK